MPSYDIVSLPGEGIGLEVIPVAIDVLKAAAPLFDINVNIHEALIGNVPFKKFGIALPQDTLEACKRSDAIIFGAVERRGLLELRKNLGLYLNLRPVKLISELTQNSPLKLSGSKSIDILFIRELSSGIYFGPSERVDNAAENYGSHSMVYHDWEIRRIIRNALAYAKKRKKHLTVVHKQNALPNIHWVEIAQQEARAFPEITVTDMLVDSAAMKLVTEPESFDVIVSGNLFGDILSDIGGAIIGSLGMLGSASLNESNLGLFEPVHGTAPELAGHNTANPIGAIESIVMMLDHMNETACASCISNAVVNVLKKGIRTRDIKCTLSSPAVGTKEMGKAIISEISSISPRISY